MLDELLAQLPHRGASALPFNEGGPHDAGSTGEAIAELGDRAAIARIPGEGANVIPVVGDGITLDANTTKPTGVGGVIPFSFVPTWTGTLSQLKTQIDSDPSVLVDDAPRFQEYVTQCIRLGWPLNVNGVIYCASQMSFVAVGPRLDLKNIGYAVLVGGPTIAGRLFKVINTSGSTVRATDGSLFGINFDIQKMPTGALNSANGLEVTGFRRFDIDCCNFYSGDNYQTAGGDAHIFFANGGGRITRCNFTGAVDLGIYVSATYDGLQDKEGLLIQGNTFKHCANAWAMKRNFQNWRAIGNWYKGCRNGAGLPGDMTDATGEGLKTGSLGIISGDVHQNCVASCLDFRDTHGVKADIVVTGTFGVDKDGNQTTSACAVKLDNADGCDITFLYEATSTDSGHSAVRIQNGSVDNRVRGVVMGTIANGLLETNGENNTVDLKLGAAVTAPGTIVGANTQFSYDKQGTREFLIGPYSRLPGRRPFSTTVSTTTTTINLNAVNRTIQFQPSGSTIKAILPSGAANGDEISILRKSGSGAGLVQVRNPGDTATILNLTDAGQIASFRWDGANWIFVTRSVSDRVLTLIPTAASSVATPPNGAASVFIDSTSTSPLSVKDNSGAAIGLQYASDNLTAIAGLATAANKLTYWTGAGTAALADFSAFGRSLVDDADASAARTTLGLGTAATLNTGTSGATVPRNDTQNVFSANQQISHPTSATQLTLNAVDGQEAVLLFRNSQSLRWRVGKTTGSETGGNASSSFYIVRYDDNGSQLGTAMFITRSNGDISFGGKVQPNTDNTYSLGGASNRWSVVYAGTGTINTSDEREKNWLRSGLTEAELRAGRRIMAELGTYQWLDAVAEKGEDEARWHFGVRAQRVLAILDAEGLDWRRYAWCCYDKWDATDAVTEPVMATDEETGKAYDTGEVQEVMPAREAGDRYGLRVDQLTLFLIAVNDARLAALEGV